MGCFRTPESGGIAYAAWLAYSQDLPAARQHPKVSEERRTVICVPALECDIRDVNGRIVRRRPCSFTIVIGPSGGRVGQGAGCRLLGARMLKQRLPPAVALGLPLAGQ